MTRYIFPGGELDHIGLSLDNLEIHEFDIHDVEGLREHYAKTCRIWADRLYARRHEAEAMIGEAKTHLWLLYLARCSIAFERGALAIFQTLASKRAPGASGLPPTRADLYARSFLDRHRAGPTEKWGASLAWGLFRVASGCSKLPT